MICSSGLCQSVVRQISYSSQDSCRKYLLQKKKKSVTCVCVNLEKAFDRVSHQVLWWAMRKLEVDERIIQLVHLSEM